MRNGLHNKAIEDLDFIDKQIISKELDLYD